MHADLILTNGRVLTMDAGRPRAEAVALRAGRVQAVGTAAGLAHFVGPETRVIDVGGRTVLPGFVESHLHLVLGGAELTQLQLGGLHGMENLRAAFAEYAAANPDKAAMLREQAGVLGVK